MDFPEHASCLENPSWVASTRSLAIWGRSDPVLTSRTSRSTVHVFSNAFRTLSFSSMAALALALPGASLNLQVEIGELKQLLTDVGVSEPVKDFICDPVRGLGLESKHDFANYVPLSTYEAEWTRLLEPLRQIQNQGEEGVEKPAVFQLDKQTSRVRRAYKHLRDELAAAAIAAPVAAPAALASDEDPLPTTVLEALRRQWRALYSDPDFGPYETPADTLISKFYRENLRVSATVHPVNKVKSLMHSSMPLQPHQYSIGQAVLSVGPQDTANRVRTIIDYNFGQRLLAHGYVFTGSHEVASKRDPNRRVLFSPLDVNVTYCADALRIAASWRVSAATALHALMRKDIATRSTMVQYMRRGWPQGEALTQALLENQVKWETAPQGAMVDDDSEDDGGDDGFGGQPPPPRKKPRKPMKAMKVKNGGKGGGATGGGKGTGTQQRKTIATGSKHRGKDICKQWNDNRGCSQKCPHNALHVCDALNARGEVCGSNSHSRAKHPSPTFR